MLTGVFRLPVFSQESLPKTHRLRYNSCLLSSLRDPFTSLLTTSVSLASNRGRIIYHHGWNHCHRMRCLPTSRRLLRTIATPYRRHTSMIIPYLTRRPYSLPLNCPLIRRALLAVLLPPPPPLTSIHSPSTPLCHRPLRWVVLPLSLNSTTKLSINGAPTRISCRPTFLLTN